MHPFLRFILLAIVLFGLSTAEPNTTKYRLDARDFINGPWSLRQEGTTGVSGLELAITSETTAIIFDKVEHNPLQTNGHVAWAAEYDLLTNTVRALNPLSNTWCAGGTHLSNGTFVSTGGNPVVLPEEGDLSGLQAIRLFDGCQDKSCDIFEDPGRVRLASNRWYPAVARLDDGSVIIFGGSIANAFANSQDINNPTYEFFPPKNIHGHNGVPIPNQFLLDTLNANHFPLMFLLPSGSLFIAANTGAMLFDWRTNTETRLPNIPNGVRVTSPFSSASALLPLSPPNYTPTVLICGGSTISDTIPPLMISSQTPASNQCVRITLDDAGIKKGWEVEHMPQPRVMGEAILLPDGRVVVVNGAQTGAGGRANVGDPIGESNADHPTFQPFIYDPAAPAGSRFSSNGLPTSPIARLYHSTSTLTPNGTVLIAGSNPNNDFTTTAKYPTEYRVEHISPAYMNKSRPSYTGLPATIAHNTTFTLNITLPAGVTKVFVSLMDLGFSTHGVHMDQRLVHLTSTLSASRSLLTITSPPSGNVYPPGPAYLFVVTDAGVPSFGHRLLVGEGEDPPVDQGAIDNLLANSGPQSPQWPPQSLEEESGGLRTSPIPVPP